MGLESRVASHRDFSPSPGRFCLNTIKKGAPSSSRASSSAAPTSAERQSKKSATTKITSWCIRADVVRKLDRGEPQPEVVASASAASGQAQESSEEIHY